MSAPVDTARRPPRRDAPVTLTVHVQLDGAFPPVWRRLEVASDLGLEDLHDVLQVVFGWQDYHLHRFTTGPEDDPGEAFACAADLAEAWEGDISQPTWDVRVDELLAEPGERLHYQYDYGDNWWLTIEVEQVTEATVPPGRVALLEGAGPGPPEDCGGVWGYRAIVAAADPAHPDHRQARAELADRWGVPIDEVDLGVVPFNLDALADQLLQLDLPDRPEVPRQLGPHLAALLLRVRDRDTARQLRVLASAADGHVEIGQDAMAAMVRPLTVMFDVVGDGPKLTAAGYLPPAFVSAIFEELDLADEWIGKGNREDLTYPVLELREATQQLGLLRRYKGRLVPTPAGRGLADDPVGLWRHVASRLPTGGKDFSDAGWHAGVLLLALMAAGTTEHVESDIARLLTELGWAVGDGQPVDRRAARGLVAEDVRLLQRLGALDHERQRAWPGLVTPGGIALARAALGDGSGSTQERR